MTAIYALRPVLVTPPGVQLVTQAEAKAHLRVDHDDENALIDGLIAAAGKRLDGYDGILGRALITQSWKIEASDFSDVIRLPIGNLLSLTSVKYYNTSNTQQTASATLYHAVTDAIGPLVMLKASAQWPAVYDRPDAIEIIWSAGYGPAVTDMPAPIRAAVLLMIGHWYKNRETVADGTLTEIPLGATSLLEPYRLNRI